MHQMMSLRNPWIFSLLLGFSLVAALPHPASANDPAASGGVAVSPLVKQTKLDKLMASADAVVEARVAKKEARWVGGIVETTHTLDVVRDYKGNLSKTTPQLEVTQMGGLVEGFPVGMSVQGNAYLAPEEEVLLFLDLQTEERYAAREAKRVAAGLPARTPTPGSKLWSSPQIVGRHKGKFSILTLPDGRRFVTRDSLVGTTMNDGAYKRLRDYQMSQLKKQYLAELEAEEREKKRLRGELAPEEYHAELEARRDAASDNSADDSGEAVIGARKKAKTSDKSIASRSHLRAAPNLVPYNSDILNTPVPFELFEYELKRLVDGEAD